MVPFSNLERLALIYGLLQSLRFKWFGILWENPYIVTIEPATAAGGFPFTLDMNYRLSSWHMLCL